MFIPNLSLFWSGFIVGIISLALWQHFVKGRLMCLLIGMGHAFSILKEEICRPLRVIRKALSRKAPELDEIEKSIS